MIVKQQAYGSLGSAPKEYSSSSFSNVIRIMQTLLNDLTNPQKIKIVGLNYTDYPTSPTGLRPGDVWVDTGAGNVLKVVV